MPMKAMNRKNLVLLLALCLSACAKKSSSPGASGSAAANPQAMPAGWVAPEKGTPAAADPAVLTEPSSEASQSIRVALKANTDALTMIHAPAAAGLTSDAIFEKDLPKGRVPWHLDGMIADFAFTTDGLFGALLGEGEAALKVTWTNHKKDEDIAASKAPVKTSVKKATTVTVSSRTTPAELNRQLEPTVRAALASGTVKNESALRSNLAKQALTFLNISRVLSKLPPPQRLGYRNLPAPAHVRCGGPGNPRRGRGRHPDHRA